MKSLALFFLGLFALLSPLDALRMRRPPVELPACGDDIPAPAPVKPRQIVRKAPADSDRCSEKPDKGSGSCGNPKPGSRFYYYKRAARCTEFKYLGCEGSGNNFVTEFECIRSCVGNPCKFPAKAGPCRGSFPKFYFDSMDGKCKQFTYGGCAGNLNSFSSRKDCQLRCRGGKWQAHRKSRSPQGNVCGLPKKTGRCRAYFRRWYFSSDTNRCEVFVYGGCGSNGNNFHSEAACNAKCGDQKEVEPQPQD